MQRCLRNHREMNVKLARRAAIGCVGVTVRMGLSAILKDMAAGVKMDQP